MAAMVSAPAQRARPETNGRSDSDRPLPVLPALEPLFSTGGLRRGSAVTVRGSASLLLALLAGPSRRGAWCGVVGLPGLGLVAAAEAGIELERLALVPDPGRDWAAVTAALLDAMEVVVVAPPGRVQDGEVRRLAARARQRGAVLVPFGAMAWPGADLRLSLASGTWEGLGDGSGHLRARRVLVRGEGRGSAARSRELALWLPGPDGEISAVPEPALHAVPSLAAAPLPSSGGGDAPHLHAVPDLPFPPPDSPLPLPPADPSRTEPSPDLSRTELSPDDPSRTGLSPAGPEPVIGAPAITTLWQDVIHRPGATVAPAAGRRADPHARAGPGGPGRGGVAPVRRPVAAPPRSRPAGPPVPAGRSAPVGGGPPPPTGGTRVRPATAEPRSHPATAGTGQRPETTGTGPRPGTTGTGQRPGTTGTGQHPGAAGTGQHPGAAGTGPRPGTTGTGQHPGTTGTGPRPGTTGTGQRPGGGGAGQRPGIPAEVLARLRPASSLPRPPARAAEA
jgi:hypothetical protein